MRPLVLLVVWAIPICAIAQDTPAEATLPEALVAQIESGEADTEDLRLQLRFRQSEGGLVRIHTFNDGPTLFASVVHGQPVDYLGSSDDGRVLTLTEAETEYGGETSCWRCAMEDGTACWQVLCLAPVGS